ncbi:MAG TPA: hypothetical protein ENI23_02015 [bacterium]|nr:hypothetical protein [bacterium]
MIRKNCLSLLPGEGVCSARAGLALLGGILRCGRCGRKLYVAYHGKSGSAARYICKGDYESDGKYCLAFGGSTVDKEFSKELLRIISPYGVEASIEAERILSVKEEEKIKVIEKKIQELLCSFVLLPVREKYAGHPLHHVVDRIQSRLKSNGLRYLPPFWQNYWPLQMWGARVDPNPARL